eukprot:TRINITY_DN33172_c0_g2_i1.p1 TRINITY_DN33172_c0_g2~~TRINITY_DN33172_c0_g2_i1.p1  ORF type:complete len:862 (+),score=173.43 TRINITY_DN33172_c0_g2_i1:70-2586(+)
MASTGDKSSAPRLYQGRFQTSAGIRQPPAVDENISHELNSADVCIRNTFIDLYDPFSESARSTSRIRSSSCGDKPAASSAKVSRADLASMAESRREVAAVPASPSKVSEPEDDAAGEASWQEVQPVGRVQLQLDSCIAAHPAAESLPAPRQLQHVNESAAWQGSHLEQSSASEAARAGLPSLLQSQPEAKQQLKLQELLRFQPSQSQMLQHVGPQPQQPGLQQPGPQKPGLQQPGLQQPGLQQPGLQQPGLQIPSRPAAGSHERGEQMLHQKEPWNQPQVELQLLDRLMQQPDSSGQQFSSTGSAEVTQQGVQVASGAENPTWLEGVQDVETALQLAWTSPRQLSIAGIVPCLHLIAKLSEQDAFGRLQGLSAVIADCRFTMLIQQLRRMINGLESPRNIMRVMWAFGKLGAWNADVEAIIIHISKSAPPRLHHFSSQELSNVLWGLARLRDAGGPKSRKFQELALALVREGARRLSGFSPQCLTNTLWAVAKLDLAGKEVQQFANACIAQVQALMFQEMSPQGLANSLWACAKLEVDSEVAKRFCYDAARRATASADLLKLFFPQELSMAVWAMARLVGRRTRSRSRGANAGNEQVERFALSVAQEACERIHDFSPQGVSNIAWALATLELARFPDTVNFFEDAAQVASANISKYPPQAIANLCWALSRGDGRSQVLASFQKAAALEAQLRLDDFSWQDLSGIVSALMQSGVRNIPEVHQFASSLVMHASCHCPQIGTQALLNIALSAVRLKVSQQVVTNLALRIAEIFPERIQSLNDIDLRQWSEVQRYCSLPGSPGSIGTASTTASPSSSGTGGSPFGKGGGKGAGRAHQKARRG